MQLRPLVKWAGGKRQMLPAILHHILPHRWSTYFEPFAGGLALLVELYNRGLIGTAVISDVNAELTNLYNVVKERCEELIETIAGYGFSNMHDYYYGIRERFNEIRGDKNSSLERAAVFLYLNRHGYNGLWRVNRRGDFNVPYGQYVNPRLPAPEHIRQFSALLGKVEILDADFTTTVKSAAPGDIVYFDPPYFPVSETSSFTDYTASGFTPWDQERLLKTCRDLDRRGVKFILSNSGSPDLDKFYSEFGTTRVSARRNINSIAGRRGGHTELIVTNL